ncbi:MAG: DUF3822 family protein [Bacteroidales bacterium]|jgi:hypothetical protein|nr:DUF3822 family protein [Bacteroidales bacterium]
MSEIIFDNYFEPDKTHEYTLSVYVSLDVFSFSVVNTSARRLLAYSTNPLKISNETFLARRFNEWVESEKLFRKEFKKINIIFDTEKFTIVPEDYYDCDLKSAIMNLVFDITGDVETEEIKITELNARLLFCIPSGMKDIFKLHFKKFEFVHPVKTLTENFPDNDKKFKLIAYFGKHCFYVLLFEDVNLLLSNSFIVLHENDPVFYILSLLKQMRVQKQAVDLFVAGDVAADSKLYANVQEYIPSVQVLKYRKPLQIDEDMLRELGINGFSLLLC